MVNIRSSSVNTCCETHQPIVEALDEPADIGALLDKAKRLAEANLRDNVIRNKHSPWRKVHLLACLSETLVELGDPIRNAGVDEWLHLLDIAERVFMSIVSLVSLLGQRRPESKILWTKGTKHTWSSCDLAEVGMLFAVLHIEQRLRLAKAASDVMLRLVGLPVVDLWQLGRIADKQHCGRDTNHGAWYVTTLSAASPFLLLQTVLFFFSRS